MRYFPISEEVVATIRKKLSETGVEGVNTKELVILLGAHFNDEVETFRDEVETFRKNLHKIGWALFWVGVSFVISFTAGLILLFFKI